MLTEVLPGHDAPQTHLDRSMGMRRDEGALSVAA
jgi:hypothetical protein